MNFCILNPLKSKRAEVVSKLLEIFIICSGCSAIRQRSGIFKCHNCSQGAVERLNGVVQEKLAIWMRENECKRWSMGLKFVQWQIHETTVQSPFKTFGEKPQIGLESYALPKSLVGAAKTEEEIEEFLTSQEANDEERQTRAAAKMTRRSKKMLIPPKIGQNCTLRVPDVDRGPADPKNFLAIRIS
ncbi:KRAB-A domain-containing protein 2 [Trichinella sp. T6]|nr:KRAB-A domain-containing protein 2 [Trichinella sp. T6]